MIGWIKMIIDVHHHPAMQTEPRVYVGKGVLTWHPYSDGASSPGHVRDLLLFEIA
jgi:hypothetical protein